MQESVGDESLELPPEMEEAMERVRALAAAMRARAAVSLFVGVALEDLSVREPDGIPSEDEVPF